MSKEKLCIICGKCPADTAQHFPFKKSMLQKFYGKKDPFQLIKFPSEGPSINAELQEPNGTKRPILSITLSGRGLIDAENAKDRQLKPVKNLCDNCNHDDAAENSFSDWHDALTKKAVKFASKHPNHNGDAAINVEDKNHEKYRNTLRYLATQLACELDLADYIVPNEVKDVVNGSTENAVLEIRIRNLANTKTFSETDAGDQRLASNFSGGTYKTEPAKICVEFNVTYGPIEYAIGVFLASASSLKKNRGLKS